MKHPTIALIIAVYKDVEALKLIIEALHHQSLQPDEIIITEDGEDSAMGAYIQSLSLPLTHLTQADLGWRKNRALNRAISAAQSQYLIFIDGDCVPYDTFVEAHALLSQPRSALCGRRSEPGEHFSTKLRRGELSMKRFRAEYLRNFFALKRDHIRHYEQGIALHPRGWLYRLIQNLRNKEVHLVGCNFSCYKEDLLNINGFDEDFTLPTTGEDSDIERRLRHFGVQMRSCKNAANMVHLYHQKRFNPEISRQTEALMQSKSNLFVCTNGLSQHLPGVSRS